MGTSKAALEWHGSTLLLRTVGIVARGCGGPVVVVRAHGQELPALPKGTLVVDDPLEGKGPIQGIAAGLGALRGRADVAFVCSTDMPFLHPAFVRRVLGVLGDNEDTGVALPVARGFKQPLAAAYRVSLADAAERLVREDRLRLPPFLFDECVVEQLDDEALRLDPVLAALDLIYQLRRGHEHPRRLPGGQGPVRSRPAFRDLGQGAAKAAAVRTPSGPLPSAAFAEDDGPRA